MKTKGETATLTRENLDAFLEGLAILGTGGGGSPEWGRAILEHDFDMGRAATIVEPEEVPDDAVVASGGIMGSVKVLDKMTPEALMRRWDERFDLAEAFRVMEETIGHKIDYVVPCEMGGLNTPVILTLGARTGRPVVNGDGIGRASPETNMVSFVGYGISLTPMPLVDFDGNVVVVRHGVESTFADSLGRWVITRGGGLGANSHYPMTGSQLKKSVVPHTITKALELGEALLRARLAGRNPVQAVVSELEGCLIHRGTVETIQEQEWEGFYFTRARVTGDVEIVIKNEAMALFVGGKLATIFPDLICMLDPTTGRGLMSANLNPGDKLAIVVAACHPRLREALESEVARKAYSPARFGLPGLTNVPVSELLPQLGRGV